MPKVKDDNKPSETQGGQTAHASPKEEPSGLKRKRNLTKLNFKPAAPIENLDFTPWEDWLNKPSPPPPAVDYTTGEILVFLIDIDDCCTPTKMDERVLELDKLIEGNAALIDYILNQITDHIASSGRPPDSVVIASSSNRQSGPMEKAKNMKSLTERLTLTSVEILEGITNEVNLKQNHIPVKYDKALMQEVYSDEEYGTTAAAIKAPAPEGVHGHGIIDFEATESPPSGKSYQFAAFEDKLALSFWQVQRLARECPHARLVVHMLDDNHALLTRLCNFLDDVNTDLVPKTARVCFQPYKYKQEKMDDSLGTVQGTGEIVRNVRESVKRLVLLGGCNPEVTQQDELNMLLVLTANNNHRLNQFKEYLASCNKREEIAASPFSFFPETKKLCPERSDDDSDFAPEASISLEAN